MTNIKELMRKYYKAGSTGDWQTWQVLLDDKVVMDEQLAGRLEGSSAMKAILDRIQTHYTKFDMRPHYMVAEGNEVCTGWQLEAVTSNGVPINATGAHYCRFENGKIVYMSNFHDTVPWKADIAFRNANK